MRKLLPLVLVAALAASARAHPLLDKCLAFAPPVCGLSDKSPQDEFLSCFEGVTLNVAKPAEAACAEELAHARVHKSCSGDIPKICAGVKPGNNRTMNCLRRNKKNLGKECRNTLRGYDLIAPPATDSGERKKGRNRTGVSAVRC